MEFTDLNEQQILEEIKDCVHMAGHPTFDDTCLCDARQKRFVSTIKNGSSIIHFWGWYVPSHRYAMLRFASEDEPIALKDSDAARQIINGINAHTPFYHYSLCPHCNGIELHFALYVPIKGFPRKKFGDLFQALIGESINIRPMIIDVIRKGGTFDDLQEVRQGQCHEPTAEAISDTKGEKNEEETIE